MKRGLDKLKEIFWYSDSEPNEVLIAFCHIIALPASLLVEFDNPSLLFILGSLGAGAFQLWAVLWCGQLRMRLLAVQIATLIAIMTIINLSAAGLMSGSRTGWIIIGVFAVWNTIRVFNEKIAKDGW
jgi:hypothetical protein